MAPPKPSPAPAATTPVLCELLADGASAAEVIEALDAALLNDLDGLRVRVLIGTQHPDHGVITTLCADDPRIEIGAPPACQGLDDAVVVHCPAKARLGVRSLEQIRERAVAEGRPLELSLAGPAGLLGRVAPGRRTGTPPLRALAPGASGSPLRAAATEFEVYASGRPIPTRHRPVVELGPERAEHLRHRARSATYRARVDRQTQRLSRERMQTRHEKSRLTAIEEQLAAASPRDWAQWRSAQVSSVARSVPGRAKGRVDGARGFARRGRRLVVDRLRRRRLASGSDPKKLPRAPVAEDQPRG